MIKLKYIAGAGLLLLAAGCTTQTTVVASNYDAQLNQFLNQPENTVVATWGAPSVRTKLSNGGEALVFVVLDDSGTGACSTVMTTDSGIPCAVTATPATAATSRRGRPMSSM